MDDKLKNSLNGLSQQIWETADQSLRANETSVYDLLVDFRKRLMSAVATSSETSEVHSKSAVVMPIWAEYKGSTYNAQIDLSRGSRCVFFNGEWRTPSGAGTEITSVNNGGVNNVNGWNFFRYRRPNGKEGRISELRTGQ